MYKSKINYVVSFGTLCVTSFLIKKSGMKKCSYPFDWIFSSPTIINDCIDTDFKLFLDREQYIDHPSGKDKCGHKTYNTCMFNHIDVRITENYDYLTRCVERFRNLLKNNNNKLFILTYVRFKEKLDKKYKDEIFKLNKILDKNTTNYHILVINCLQTGKQNTEITKEDNITYIEMETISSCNGVEFIDKQDNEYYINTILNLYEYDIYDDIKTNDKDIM
jgi:hypothetical protein